MSKDIVNSFGVFLYNQLIGLDNTTGCKEEISSTLPVLATLRSESKSRVDFNKFSTMTSNGTLKLKDGQCKGVSQDDDERLARLLQEEEWKMMKQRGNVELCRKKCLYQN